MLALPNFTKLFVLECDAIGNDIRVVLTQEVQPLAFTSQLFSGRNLGQSTYEKEMMDILHVMDTWKPCFLRWCFHIKTDHHSLEYFLEKCLSSPQ